MFIGFWEERTEEDQGPDRVGQVAAQPRGIHVRLTPGPTPPWEESGRRKWLRRHQASHSHEGATNKDTVGLVGMNVAGQERAELSALDISPVLRAWYLQTEMNQKPRMHRADPTHLT